ncbi:MAG: hypothetical protein V3S46_08435 [Nitrospinota bacterium]
MKRIHLKANDRKVLEKVERVIAETVVHRRPFEVTHGVWPFVVFGPDANGNAAIRVGSAEQARIQSAPIYIATLGGPHIPDSEGIPLEELAGDDIPEELKGMMVFQMSPMRPLSIQTKRQGPPIKEAVSEVCDFYKGNDTAVIETPDESYWAVSVLKYLDETDKFFPDPVLSDFYSRLGNTGEKPFIRH